MTALDLDWRFLLPLRPDAPARRLLLLGGSPALADELARARIAEEVIVAPGPEAEIVASLAGARVRLSEAARKVAPGGILYHESAWPLRRDPIALAQRLGLTVVGLYWVQPRLLGPRTYVPLNIRSGLRWYLDNLRVDRGRLADAAARFVIALGPRRWSLLAPRLALVAVADGGAEPYVFARDALRPDLHGALSPLLLAHGDDLSRVVLFPFTRESHQPVAVVKLHRHRVPANEATDEHVVLERIREHLDPKLRATIPEPLATMPLAGRVATVETFLEGDWLLALWAGRRSQAELAADLEVACDWLADFQRQSAVERRPWSQGDAERWVGRAVAAYKEAFGATAAECRLFAQLEGQAHEAVGVALPVVWHHTDFSSLNIIRRERTIGVIDWENAAPGLPLDDLLYFVTRWLYRTFRAEGESSSERAVAAGTFRRLFFERRSGDANLDLARGAIARYVQALELDARLVPLLFANAWLSRAVGRVRRETSSSPATDVARAGNRYVTLVGIAADHAERLRRGGLPWLD
jgi:aminoglycoside phosphotransferase (APT) family kinase protein